METINSIIAGLKLLLTLFSAMAAKDVPAVTTAAIAVIDAYRSRLPASHKAALPGFAHYFVAAAKAEAK